MEARTNQSLTNSKQGKYKKITGQMNKVFNAFYSSPKTMLMVSIETGILRANICRYVAYWEKNNRIQMMRKGICPITKNRAGFYTTSTNAR